MSRRSVTTVTFKVRLRLPPGVAVKQAKLFLESAIREEPKRLSLQDPLAALSLPEVFILLDKRETVYLGAKA